MPFSGARGPFGGAAGRRFLRTSLTGIALLSSATFLAVAVIATSAVAAPLPKSPPAPARLHVTPVTAGPAQIALPEARAYVLVDVGTGKVLAGYHERTRVRPASLTKVLTALIAVAYLRAGAGVAGTTQSENAYPNKVGMERGVKWPLADVLQALLVFSANDAAYALAQRIGGSLAGFGKVMDSAAHQIGMADDPDFHDPAGLDGSEGVRGGNWVSARDLAIAGRDLLAVPALAAIVKEHGYHFVDPTGALHWLPSMDYTFLESYAGAIGIKTGFTDAAGACIMAAATRHGRTMLAVVMDGYNPAQSAIDLLNDGFATPPASEPGSDRLPPVSQPSPRGGVHGPHGRHERGRPGRHGRHGGGALSGARGQGASHGPGRYSGLGVAHGRLAGAMGPAAARGGLGSVMANWLGQFLLVVTGLAALVALWELVKFNRARALRLRAGRTLNPLGTLGPPPSRPGSPPLPMLSSSRRRRERLVASYSRHERSAGHQYGPRGLG